MVKLLPPHIINIVRAGRPLQTTDTWGRTHPDKDRVDLTEATAYNASCRCCGSILDKGTPVYKITTFIGCPDRVRKPASVYIHRDDCLRPGFVRTVDYNGKMPGNFAFVGADGNAWEGTYEQQPESFFNFEDGHDVLQFKVISAYPTRLPSEKQQADKQESTT